MNSDNRIYHTNRYLLEFRRCDLFSPIVWHFGKFVMQNKSALQNLFVYKSKVNREEMGEIKDKWDDRRETR